LFVSEVLRLIVPNHAMDNICPAETFGAGIYPSIPITFLNILNDTSVKRALGLIFDK
jgi:hypothetical protein